MSQNIMSIIEDFFQCIVVLSLRDNIAQGFNLCKVVPKSIKTSLQKIFSCAMLSKYILDKKITCELST